MTALMWTRECKQDRTEIVEYVKLTLPVTVDLNSQDVDGAVTLHSKVIVPLLDTS